MKIFKSVWLRFASLLLVCLLVFGMIPITANAVMYPYIMTGFGMGNDYQVPYGEVAQLKFTLLGGEYKYEKYHINIYDSYGNIAATAEGNIQWGTAVGVRYLTVTLNTREYDVGNYVVEAYPTFYSFNTWNDTPNSPRRFNMKIVKGYTKGSYINRDDVLYKITNATSNTVEYVCSYDNEVTDLIIPSEVNFNNKDYEITSVGYGAMYYMNNPTSVTIPASVTKIDDILTFMDEEEIASFVIKGIAGSAAEKFAKANGCVFEKIAATCHTYIDGVCVVCGKWKHQNSAVTLKSVANHASGVKVIWSKLSGAKKYYVYRKTKTSGWARLGSTTGTSFIDKTAKSNTTYWYTVKGQNGTAVSLYNKTGLKVTYMAAPQIVSIANTNTGILFKWGKTSGATMYYVYRKTTGGWSRIGTTNGNIYLDKTAKSGVKYTYTIIAVKSGAASSFWSGSSLMRLTTPKLVKVNVASGINGVVFGKVSGATSYFIYRKTNNGNWVRLAVTKTNFYVDRNVKKGVYYTYTVRAANGSSASSYNTAGIQVKAK